MGKLGDYLKRHNVVGSLISGVGSIAGMIGQNKIVNKQIAAQREENRLNRYYNQMLARQQNQWNLEQWNRENAYNSPLAQMYRLRQAGLNPDLMYGQGTTGNSFSSPEMTSGAPSESQDMSAMLSKRSFGQTMQQIFDKEQQRRMNEAQIEAIRATAREKNVNANATEIESAIAQAREGRDVQLFGLTLRNTRLLGDKTDAEIKSVFQGIEVMKKDVDRIVSETDKNRALVKDLDNQQIERVKESYRRDLQTQSMLDLNDATIKKLISERNLNAQKLKEAFEIFPLVKAGMEDENKIRSKEYDVVVEQYNSIKQDIKRGELDFENEAAQTWYQRSNSAGAKIVRFFDQTTGILGRVLGGTVSKSLNKAPITQRVTNNNIYNR